MRCKLRLLLAAALLLAAVSLVPGASAQAATLSLLGSAQISGSSSRPRVALAADGGGWHLVATLDGQATQGPRTARQTGNLTFALVGPFTLTHAGVPAISGTATGSVAQSGAGDLTFGSADGRTQLSSSVMLDSSGSLELVLTGPLPETASAATQPADLGSHTFWYISRAAGLTAYVLLALNVCLGLMVRTRAVDWLLARWRAFDLHQFTALLALGFVLLHIFSLLGDHFIGFSVGQLLLPLASDYRPPAVALGIVAFYLIAGIIASFYLRRLLGYRAWRAIHYLTFAAFFLTLAHGILAGSDSSAPWAMLLYWAGGVSVAGLTVWRFALAGRGTTAAAPHRPQCRHREAAGLCESAQSEGIPAGAAPTP
jgi:methionine sulfoxide reductase heme-binding subunit